MKRLRRIGMPLFTLLLVLATWEGCAHILDIDLYILSTPSNIIQTLFANRDILWTHSLVTLQEAVVGPLTATLLAIVIAIGMDLSQSFRHNIFPHLVVTQTVPVMVLGLLFSVWLGFDIALKILTVIFMCFFPVVITFCDTPGKVDGHQISLSKSSGVKKWQIYAYVKIPVTSTTLFPELKVVATYCIGGAAAGEWLSASVGLGYRTIRVESGHMLDKVSVCVVVTIALNLLLHEAVVLLEAVLFSYARKKRRKVKRRNQAVC